MDLMPARTGGVRLHWVPVDEDGIRVDRLAETPATVAVVTPAHQSPTGVPLSAVGRHALVRGAEARQGYGIEDDYDSEFRYDRQAIGVLQGLAPERMFLVVTACKTLAPGLRLGWGGRADHLDHRAPRRQESRPRVLDAGPGKPGRPPGQRSVRPTSARHAKEVRHPSKPEHRGATTRRHDRAHRCDRAPRGEWPGRGVGGPLRLAAMRRRQPGQLRPGTRPATVPAPG